MLSSVLSALVNADMVQAAQSISYDQLSPKTRREIYDPTPQARVSRWAMMLQWHDTKTIFSVGARTSGVCPNQIDARITFLLEALRDWWSHGRHRSSALFYSSCLSVQKQKAAATCPPLPPPLGTNPPPPPATDSLRSMQIGEIVTTQTFPVKKP